ncbi:hypothetical protein B0H10DRAFT_2233533 [Mycena sp. CBHHK59/15]|nr:hypothetical protein B0H10DRAFT_2233533 [Mycena sp. CBHHK59/15]
MSFLTHNTPATSIPSWRLSPSSALIVRSANSRARYSTTEGGCTPLNDDETEAWQAGQHPPSNFKHPTLILTEYDEGVKVRPRGAPDIRAAAEPALIRARQPAANLSSEWHASVSTFGTRVPPPLYIQPFEPRADKCSTQLQLSATVRKRRVVSWMLSSAAEPELNVYFELEVSLLSS